MRKLVAILLLMSGFPLYVICQTDESKRTSERIVQQRLNKHKNGFEKTEIFKDTIWYINDDDPNGPVLLYRISLEDMKVNILTITYALAYIKQTARWKIYDGNLYIVGISLSVPGNTVKWLVKVDIEKLKESKLSTDPENKAWNYEEANRIYSDLTLHPLNHLMTHHVTTGEFISPDERGFYDYVIDKNGACTVFVITDEYLSIWEVNFETEKKDRNAWKRVALVPAPFDCRFEVMPAEGGYELITEKGEVWGFKVGEKDKLKKLRDIATVSDSKNSILIQDRDANQMWFGELNTKEKAITETQLSDVKGGGVPSDRVLKAFEFLSKQRESSVKK